MKPWIRRVLFIQMIPDIRTNKIAKALREQEIQTDLLYVSMHPSEVYRGYELPYTNMYRIRTVKEIVDFVERSPYDIVISCNEPDTISAALVGCSKPMIHDCHDMMSLRGHITNDQAILEFIANKYAAGNIYVTERVKEIAIQKFGLDKKPVFLLDNYVLKEQLPSEAFSKLSDGDGELHCVYQGGLTNRSDHHRFIEPMFLQMAQEHIHVHFYTPFQNDYYRSLEAQSDYLHWEGTREPNELIREMTRYDAGLVLLNVTPHNRQFLDSTFPNKAWDYLAAGLPILCSHLTAFTQFIDSYPVGAVLNDTQSFRDQLQKVASVSISRNFLTEHAFTMDDQIEGLRAYMEEIIVMHTSRHRTSS